MVWTLFNPPSMASINNALESIKTKAKKIFNPSAEKTRLTQLEREAVRDLVNRFPTDEHLLRRNIRSHLGRIFRGDEVIHYMGREIRVGKPEDLKWIEIEGLFEHDIRRMTGYNPEIMAEKLGYTADVFQKIMTCIGKGGSSEARQSASA